MHLPKIPSIVLISSNFNQRSTPPVKPAVTTKALPANPPANSNTATSPPPQKQNTPATPMKGTGAPPAKTQPLVPVKSSPNLTQK